MIPETDKSYFVFCNGPFDYNMYKGFGRFTGKTEVYPTEEDKDELIYEFSCPDSKDTIWFLDRDILAEK